MPELPEVQTIVEDLIAAGVLNSRITGVDVTWPNSIAGMGPDVFVKKLIGRRIRSVWRRGKYIVINLSKNGTLLIHLRMTGKLYLSSPGTTRIQHEHIVIGIDPDRELRFHDTRKFGRFLYTETPAAVLDRLGVEPLSAGLSVHALSAILRKRRRMLKPLLLDQRIIAGLGNIYVDEALWSARLHPRRRADTVSGDQVKRLRRSIVKVLKQGIENRGTSLGAGKGNFQTVSRNAGNNSMFLSVFRKTGHPCPRCKTPIQRTLVGQRSTHICPACQPLQLSERE